MAVDVTARQREALHEAADALRALQQTARMGPTLVKKASHALGRVRYFTRFLEEVEAFEEEAAGREQERLSADPRSPEAQGARGGHRSGHHQLAGRPR